MRAVPADSIAKFADWFVKLTAQIETAAKKNVSIDTRMLL